MIETVQNLIFGKLEIIWDFRLGNSVFFSEILSAGGGSET